jgi:hypothetical protein
MQMSDSKVRLKNYGGPIGQVTYRKNDRARNISIRVRPFKGIIVTVPRFCSVAQAERFVFTKQQWLTQTLREIKKAEENRYVFDGSAVATKNHLIRFIAKRVSKPEMYINNSDVSICYPQHISIKHSSIQNAIRMFIIEIYRLEAKTYLPVRLAELASRCGFDFQKVFIKNLKSRWGSCSAKNNINLNLNLMRLPDYLIDYVLVHELTHTAVKNHGPEFWHLLEKMCPGARRMDKELKRYSIAL